MANLALALDAEGLEVALVSLQEPQGGELEEVLGKAGLPVYHLGARGRLDPRAFVRFGKVLFRLRPDIVHSHWHDLIYPLGLPISRKGWVYTVHNLPEREAGPKGRLVRRMAMRLGMVPVAVSQAVATSFKDLYGREAFMIPNGIPLFAFSLGDEARRAWRNEQGLTERDTVFLFLGRFSPQKDPLLLLEAFSEVLRGKEHLWLFLVGDGPLRQDLEEAVIRKGIGNRVRFLGVRRDIPEILAGGDVVILPSR
ncbi:glycosyltransferase, partial [uncultured Thermus sp.]|uniref:glycosyltransferase n=1 Tax=uncultured Thermus sp. TaxID=157149 RepID=UPI00261C1FA6